MNKFKIDEDYGKEQEKKSEEYIKDYFKQTTLKKLSKFNKFDFEGDTALFEVKSRRNNHDAYPSTMIDYNKILACKKCIQDVYFIFHGTYRHEA